MLAALNPGGKPLCCDATLVSPLRRDGSPISGAPGRDGVVLAAARRRKLAQYRELNRGGAQRLCVLATEVGVGGRWSADCESLLRRFVDGSSGCALHVRHPQSARSRRARLGVLAVAVQRAVCIAVLGRWTMPALPVPLADIQARCPDAARTCAQALEQARDDTAPCLRSAAGARAVLQAEGWADCPSWSALAAGARPTAPDADEEARARTCLDIIMFHDTTTLFHDTTLLYHDAAALFHDTQFFEYHV
ncbi:unnamed protein product [Symbiodinium natans]|uniref:Uncharacterized protein n=1 Tax=Symbiodinium natans TaxID=878477 RepID=A0A812J749_9DINO|nr:unnamed protein product [Symbiodinium natans]